MKVLVADDHALFREGLRLQLEQMDGSAEVLEASGFGEALTQASGQAGLDLALIDLGMPDMDWRDGVRLFHDRFPDVPVVVISATDDYRIILQAIEIGAAGYIPKSSTGKVMLSALKLVLSGGTYLPPELLYKVSAESSANGERRRGQSGFPADPAAVRCDGADEEGTLQQGNRAVSRPYRRHGEAARLGHIEGAERQQPDSSGP